MKEVANRADLPDVVAISSVVDAFYDRVRADDLLGPIFNHAVAEWPAHLEKLKAFWSSVMLTTGQYKGNPVAAHLPHARVMTEAAFARWLLLWRETTSELLEAGPAAAMQNKAVRIAQSLSMAVAFQSGADGRAGNPTSQLKRASKVGIL